jgi:hypothetical protein
LNVNTQQDEAALSAHEDNESLSKLLDELKDFLDSKRGMDRQNTMRPLARQDTVAPLQWDGASLHHLDGSGLAFALRGGVGTKYTLGRRKGADLRIADDCTRVSGVHASVSCEEGKGWCVQDSGSSMGTTLNGKLLLPGTLTPLYNSDVLALGQGNDNTTYSSCSYVMCNAGRDRQVTEAQHVPPASLHTAEKKYGDSVLACLQNGVKDTQAAIDRHDPDGIWKAAGTVISSIKRLSEVLATGIAKSRRDITRSTLKNLRRKKRHDNHNVSVGTAHARHRRDRSNRGGKGKAHTGVRFYVTGISKS